MGIESGEDQRSSQDRRAWATSPWYAFCWKGRRARNRRASEHRQQYFVDRFSWLQLVWILSLLGFTVVDGMLTLQLLNDGYQEVNPLMDYLLGKGMLPFLLGKYTLTAAGLPLLLIFKNYYLFGTGFRVGYLIPVFVILYAILLGYQLFLLRLFFA